MIDVLVTCYNQENIIEETLMSLLNQTTDFKFNVIVSDHYSIDKSYSKIKLMSLKYDNLIITQPNNKKNVGTNRNHLISCAKNKFSIFVDGDDVQKDGFIESICKQIDNDEVYRIKNFIENWSEKEVLKKSINYYNIFLNVYKTSYLKKLSFDEDVQIGEDVLFTISNASILRHKKVKEIDACYTLNRQNFNKSLTKNGNHRNRFELELLLLEKMKELDNINEYYFTVDQKNVDLLNYALLAGNTFKPKIKNIITLPFKHLVSYIMYKVLPYKIYKLIIKRRMEHKV